MLHTNLTTTTLDFGKIKRTFYFRKGASDEAVINQVFLRNEYDFTKLRRYPEIQAFLQAQDAKGLTPLIVDAGANIGASAVYFAVRVDRARIVSIEPNDHNFDLLQKNVQGLNVRCARAAISSSRGSAKVVDMGGGNWAFRTQPGSGDPSDVPMVTLNDIYEEEATGNVYPFLVKMDIEGAEATTFDKNTEWVERTPILIIELHDWMMPKEGSSKTFLQCISKQDRDFIVDGELVYSVRHDLGV